MRKHFLFVLLLVSFYSFSQTYHFDYLMKYTSQFDNNQKMEHQFFVNSKNHNYEMRISLENKKIITKICDFENKIQHSFELIKSKFPLKNEDFKYIGSKKIEFIKSKIEAENKKRPIQYKLLEKNKDSAIYEIKEYTLQDLKNPRVKAKVTLIPISDDLATFALPYLFDYLEIYKKIQFPQNYILKEGTTQFEGRMHTLKIEYFEPQNLDLAIPKEFK